MAQVVLQKVYEVWQSVEIEYTLQKKSLQQELRNSFGSYSSLIIYRNIGVNRQANTGSSSLYLLLYSKSKFFEINNIYRSSVDCSYLSLNKSISLDVLFFLVFCLQFVASCQQDKFVFLNNLSISDEAIVFEWFFKLLNDFAAEGLHTLFYVYKYITKADYKV